jgi:hypothetical protein
MSPPESAVLAAAIERALPGGSVDAERAVYARYLASDEWRNSRATQVHHRTYQNIFNEFLFELVAVCAQCHHGIHGGVP